MKAVVEFIGTFLFVFTIGMVLIEREELIVLAPFAIGAALTVLVYAGGHVSGGHYNPAVSLSVLVRRRLTVRDSVLYWIAQFLAAAAAAYLVLYMKGFPSITAFSPAGFVLPLIAEFLFTFALCYVVLNTTTAKGTAGNSFYGLAIGFTVMVGAFAVGGVSGAAFNPAVAIGLTVMGMFPWENLWYLLVGEFLGALVAALVFRATAPKDA